MDDRNSYDKDARFLAEMMADDGDAAAQTVLGRLGEYALLAKLGEGGMGTVYKALHTELDRLVAIKVMRPGPVGEDWAAARFRREIKAVAALEHANIVRAHDARKIADTHFLVMEYVEGIDLHGLVDRFGPLGVADACELVRQAALGLQCAHEHGLVHRDIKPSNLMLSRQGQVKILDLGLARGRAGASLSIAMTAAGQVMGTPDFMAPEQSSDSHTVDIRADIYSLGCTFYKLLTGVAPFSGPEYQTLLAKLAAHCERMPPPVSQFRRDVPDELVSVLDRMLAKSPADRFATPADVAEALLGWTRGCNLCRRLSAAAGEPADSISQIRVIEDKEVSPTVRERGSTPRNLPPPRASGRSRPFWPWIIAAGVILVLLVGIAVALRSWPGKGGGSAAPANNQVAPSSGPKAEAGTGYDAEATSGWIVLSWTRPRMGKPNLWLFSPDGKRRLNVTNDPRYFDIHPKFSPDGRRIAFIRTEDLTASNAVYVCNADGSDLRPVVSAREKSERFASPVWVSNSSIFYARDPKPDRVPDMEVWRVDLDGSTPRLVFRFQDAVHRGDGLVTDVSPDRRSLAIIAQTGGSPATSDVYVTDREGKNLQTVWEDRPDEWRDARALWSPDGGRIAWHHNFSRGILVKPLYFGVGLARGGAAGKWTVRLQPESETFVTPLAWSPQGGYLLCARMRDTGQKLPPATLFLMDQRFRCVQELCELDASPWQPAQRDLGRLADWAVVPEDLISGKSP